MQSTIAYSIKEGEKVIVESKIEVSGGGGGLGAAIREAQKKTNEIFTEVVERHKARGDGKAAESDEDDDGADSEEVGEEEEPDTKKLKH